MRAEMEDMAGATRLVCQFRRSPRIFIPMLMFLIVVAVNANSSVRDLQAHRGDAGAFIVAVFVAVAFGGFIAFRLNRSRDDREILLNFLHAQIDTQPLR